MASSERPTDHTGTQRLYAHKVPRLTGSPAHRPSGPAAQRPSGPAAQRPSGPLGGRSLSPRRRVIFGIAGTPLNPRADVCVTPARFRSACAASNRHETTSATQAPEPTAFNTQRVFMRINRRASFTPPRGSNPLSLGASANGIYSPPTLNTARVLSHVCRLLRTAAVRTVDLSASLGSIVATIRLPAFIQAKIAKTFREKI